MKRCSIIVLVLALVLCASNAFAIFPGYNGKTFPNKVGDGTVNIQLMHGWTQNAEAWYHCFSTNNVRLAQTENLVLTAKLTSGALPFSPLPQLPQLRRFEGCFHAQKRPSDPHFLHYTS